MAFYDCVNLAPWFCCSAALLVAGMAGCAAASNTDDVPSPIDGGIGGGDTGDMIFGDANACRPGNVTTYQPEAYHFAAAPWRGVCVIGGPSGSGQDRAFFEECLAPGATPDGCAAFRADKANDDCANCIQTVDSASLYGPLISNRGAFITTNVAGCIELTDPTALSCAKALQVRTGCELWACQANCPVRDQASRGAYDTCATQSDLTGCQSYEMAADCLNAKADAALSAQCLLPTFADFYYAVVPLFCGTYNGPVDAGADVIADAASGAAPDAGLESEGGSADASVDALVKAGADASVDARADASFDAQADVRVDARADGSADARVDAPIDTGADATGVLDDAAKD